MKDPFHDGPEKAKHVDKLSEGRFNDKITMYTVSCSSLFRFEIGRSCINFRFSATYSQSWHLGHSHTLRISPSMKSAMYSNKQKLGPVTTFLKLLLGFLLFHTRVLFLEDIFCDNLSWCFKYAYIQPLILHSITRGRLVIKSIYIIKQVTACGFDDKSLITDQS